MGRGFLFIFLGFGALVSMLSSGMSQLADAGTFHSQSNSIVTPSSDSYSAVSESGASSADGSAITLERSYDGHFYADVQVNGSPIRFLVDTGASSIALSREDARRAGLATSISMPEVVGEGAGGAVRGEIVTLERVALGTAEATDVAAIVLDGGSQSLLGQSFLRRFSSVEIRGNTMVLQ